MVAVHGGSAPFQDEADPHDWVNGERNPSATEFDFGPSGVCPSLMDCCSDNDPRPAILPHTIDFAFLADLETAPAEQMSALKAIWKPARREPLPLPVWHGDRL